MTGLSAKKEGSTIGKDDLIHQVAAKAESSLKETGKVIDAFTEIVREEVAKGKEVRLMGFGTWNLRNIAARTVKSIRGGKQITIPARKRVGFSVGAVLSQAAQPHKAKPTTSASSTPSRTTSSTPTPRTGATR